jgi:thiamine pyrophosphate-dependent acetolactate synthase large subunit-like protein
VGVCEGPSGAGALYLLPGVAEANQSSVRLIALTADIDSSMHGKGTLTELDQNALYAAVRHLDQNSVPSEWSKSPANTKVDSSR